MPLKRDEMRGMPVGILKTCREKEREKESYCVRERESYCVSEREINESEIESLGR